MKTTLHGMENLYEGGFIDYISKYADNGRAETISELKEYFKLYKQRFGREYIFQTFLDKSAYIFNRYISTDRGSLLHRQANKIYRHLKWIKSWATLVLSDGVHLYNEFVGLEFYWEF